MFPVREQAIGIYLPSLTTNAIWAMKPLSSCLMGFIFNPWCLHCLISSMSSTTYHTAANPQGRPSLPALQWAVTWGHGEGVQEISAAEDDRGGCICWNRRCYVRGGQAPGMGWFSKRALTRQKSPSLLSRWCNALESRTVLPTDSGNFKMRGPAVQELQPSKSFQGYIFSLSSPGSWPESLGKNTERQRR